MKAKKKICASISFFCNTYFTVCECFLSAQRRKAFILSSATFSLQLAYSTNFVCELVKSRIICYYNSMEKHKMIILGGGASGCMCALSTECKDVCIIDRQNKIGKKILVTGNGRCNITNRNCSDDKYNTSIEKYLERFSSLTL